MGIERQTFSESWYRVADIRPMLRPTIQVSRQPSRGRIWYFLRNSGNNEHLRIREVAYYFIAMLDGRRTVRNVWERLLERYGDESLTQGEVIQLLGQLYTSSFLRAEMTPDSEMIFRRFNRKRASRVAKGLGSLLFFRIPLVDPDGFFEGMARLFGWLFSWAGFVVWLTAMAAGGISLAGRWQDLGIEFNGLLDPTNLLWLYVGFIVIKLAHECGHGIACKCLGQYEHSNEVRTLGVMLLVLMPMPYVDVSSCWMFRSKWRRMTVSCGGVYIELLLASAAALAWANTSPGTLVHALSYNMMIVASIGSLLFNANPLMRFDGYYVLSDWLELPNLSSASRMFLSYAVKRMVWGVSRVSSPASTPREAVIYSIYGVLSLLWQIWISFRILVFIWGKYFIIGSLLAIASIIMWIVIPVGRVLQYLSMSPELEYRRLRAIGTTTAFIMTCILVLGIFSFGDNWRTEGVVEPVRNTALYSSIDGLLIDCMQSDNLDLENGSSVAIQGNQNIDTDVEIFREELAGLEIQTRLAKEEERISDVSQLEARIQAVRERLEKKLCDQSRLAVNAPIKGVLVAPRMGEHLESWVRRGECLGLVLSPETIRLRVVVNQLEAARLFEATDFHATYRIKGRPDIGKAPMAASVERIVPLGSTWLPSAALGFAGGGHNAVNMDEGAGEQTVSNTFDVWLKPVIPAGVTLFPGQRVVVRFEFPPRSLVLQWLRKARQVFNPHFQV